MASGWIVGRPHPPAMVVMVGQQQLGLLSITGLSYVKIATLGIYTRTYIFETITKHVLIMRINYDFVKFSNGLRALIRNWFVS